jgi:hypothetical protein
MKAAVVLSLKYGVRGDCDEISAVDDGYLTGPEYSLRQLAPATTGSCEMNRYFAVHVAFDGTTSERQRETVTGVCPGRRPPGLLAAASPDRCRAAGAHFARVAELSAQGAPPHLSERSRAPRRDEVRHTVLMTELASRHGAVPESVRFAPKLSQTLLELALDNAREGTSRELFGAVVAAWQSHAASSADARARFAEIARDEAEHAQLSLDLAAWLSERLSEDERLLVEHERERSFRALHLELREPVDAEVAHVAGLPNASEAQRLLRATRAELT